MKSSSPPVYRRMLSLVLRYWVYILGSTTAAVLYVAFNSISVWFTASLINSILSDFDRLWAEHQELVAAASRTVNQQLRLWTDQLLLKPTAIDTLYALCIAIVVVFALKNVFLYLKNILMTQVQTKLITFLRNRIYEHLQTLSLSYFKRHPAGVITSILITDVGNMRQAMTTTFQGLLVEPLNILSFIVLMFIISPKLTVLAGIVLPLSAVMLMAIGQSIRRKSRRTAVKIASITNIITETLGAIRIVKAFVMERYEIDRFREQTHQYYRLIMRRARLNHVATPLTETLGVIVGAVLLWIGGRDVLVTHTLTSEDFIRFILLMFSTITPIRKLGRINLQLQAGMASAERVFTILDTRDQIVEPANPVRLEEFHSGIELSRVSFRYQDGQDWVLRDVSFSIPKGKVIALVGASGAGKSTIADLIPRFYDVTEGAIRVDGTDVRECSLDSLRRLIGIVNQETILFNDTIRNNIAYGVAEVPDEAVWEAVRAANALEFIEPLPEGLHTVVGERGTKFSGGQKQRIAIARAILKNPPILILDEATSSLDTESEYKVNQAIQQLMEDRTVLVIAHRLSTVQHADEIIVLDHGRIDSRGRHQELYQQGGLYQKLYDLQFKP
ncbi:MAG: ABC transporter ATP-binding protein [Candidatus Neomarinimicrobiota bacterium]|nr:MAG: ABC transporter ATP-binding protein [Candidatus Neomarinimicrobiota bacterium]